MKKTIILTLLCIQSLLMWAQRPSFYPQTHEIGVQYGSLHSIPSLADYYQDTPFGSNAVNGIQYKYHWDLNNVIRLSASRRSADFDILDGIDRFDSYRAQKQDWDIRLGYEANLPTGPWLFFAGLEGIYSGGNITDEGILKNNDSFSGEYNYHNLGIGGMAGIRYFFSKHISTTLEANIYYADTRHDESPEDIYYLLPENETGFAIRGYISLHLMKLKKRCVCQ